MESSLFEDTSETVIIDVLINNLGSACITETFQTLFHIVPLELDTTGMHETEFFMDVSCNVADPVVIKTILSKFRLAFGHMHIRSMTVTEYYTSGYCMPLDHVYYVFMRFVFNKVHYRYASTSAKNPEHPSELGEVTHITPPLLAN